MNTLTKVALVGGAGAVVIGGALLLFRRDDATKSPSVYIAATTGGEILGDYPPQQTAYVFPSATTIHLGPAVAYQGYSFVGWSDGYHLLTEAAEFDLAVNRSLMRVTAVFESTTGIIPTAITTSSSIVYPEHHLQVWKSGYIDTGNGKFDYFHIGTRMDRVGDQVRWKFIRYKLVDASGNGVPNKKLNFYIEPHDPADPQHTFFAVIKPDGYWVLATPASPVTFVSDEEGYVEVGIVMMWAPPDPKSDYGNIVKQSLHPWALSIDWTGLIWGRHEVKDNIELWEGVIPSGIWWKAFEWGTGSLTDLNANLPIPQSQEVLAYQSTPSPATAYSVDNPAIENNQVVAVGMVYLPPNIELEVYNGDYL